MHQMRTARPLLPLSRPILAAEEGDARECAQALHIDLVAGRFIQMGNVGLGNCDWNLLARRFQWLSSCPHNFCRDQFGLRHIRMGEAINIRCGAFAA